MALNGYNTTKIIVFRCEDPKLIIRIINFELVEPIRPWYVNVTDGRYRAAQNRI